MSAEKKITFVLLLMLPSLFSIGQEKDCCCAPHIINQRILPMPQFREADIIWSKQLIREVDLHQKLNQIYYNSLEGDSPRLSLFELMVKEISEGCMIAYETGPILKSKKEAQLSIEDFNQLIYNRDTISTYNTAGDKDVLVVQNKIESQEITRYQIKEQWIFDKQRSQMITLVTAIAPMIEVYGEDGDFRGFKTLFWINYQESRKILSAYPAQIDFANNEAVSYDDLFAKKYYDGFIVKISNLYDRDLREFFGGLELLEQGALIEKKIKDMHSDMWTY